MNQKNKIGFFILLVLFSLMSVLMPISLFETQDYNDCEGLFKNTIHNIKISQNLSKLFKRLRTFILTIFKLPLLLSRIVDLVNIRLVLFNMRFSIALILILFSVLCSYFHVGKFRIV